MIELLILTEQMFTANAEFNGLSTEMYTKSDTKYISPLRTVVAYMRQGNKLDYHVQTNRYNFATLHPTNLKLLSFCSVCSAENSNVLGRT